MLNRYDIFVNQINSMSENSVKIEVDPFLLDEIVFYGIRELESIGENMSLYNRYQNERDLLYDYPYEKQNKAFYELNVNFFSLLGHSDFLFKIVNEFPVLLKKVGLISFIKAQKRVEEGADLFFQTDNGMDGCNSVTTLVFKILPEKFLNKTSLKRFFRCEFLHMQDMLDDNFGYIPSLNIDDQTMMRSKLIQDRYRVLWQGYVDARLSERYPDFTPANITAGMLRVFPNLTQNEAEEILHGLKVRKWTHSSLLEIARIDSKDFRYMLK